MIVYTTAWCGYCHRLKRALERAEIPYTEVDIEGDPQAAAFVVAANGGNATVPTVRFPDGTTATNPSLQSVLARLDAA